MSSVSPAISPASPPPTGGARPATTAYQRLSIVIPCYNEKRTLRAILERVVSTPLPLEREIILVDDGSTDGTRDLIREIERGFPASIPGATARCGFRVVLHEKNRGKGAALRTGFTAVTGDLVLIQDADLEYDPGDYAALIKPFLENGAKVVYGSRWFHEPMHYPRRGGFTFRFGNWLLTTLTNVLYGAKLTDEATCYKVFDAALLRSIPLACTGFEFCPEVTAKLRRAGHRIHEVPIAYHPRSFAEGKKIRSIHGVEAIWTLIKYRFGR